MRSFFGGRRRSAGSDDGSSRRTRHPAVPPAPVVPAPAVPVGDDGVPVGDDAAGRALVLGVHRAAPYDVLLIGGLWTAQVLALRTRAAGVRVAVETARAQVWEQVRDGVTPDRAGAATAGGLAADRADGTAGAGTVRTAGAGTAGTAGAGTAGADGTAPVVDLFDVGRVPALGAAEGRPVLVVRDCGMRPPRGRVVPAPWQSVLTLLPYLSPVAPRLIRDSALVGVQRVSPEEAERIGQLLGLGRQESDALPGLGDGVTLWCAGQERHWVTTTATGAERALLGPARRMD